MCILPVWRGYNHYRNLKKLIFEDDDNKYVYRGGHKDNNNNNNNNNGMHGTTFVFYLFYPPHSITNLTVTDTAAVPAAHSIAYYHHTLLSRLQVSHISIYIGVLDAFAKLRKATLSFVKSVFPSALRNSAPTGYIFMKFDIWVFFENLSREFKFH
jgi:hypothetical protein